MKRCRGSLNGQMEYIPSGLNPLWSDAERERIRLGELPETPPPTSAPERARSGDEAAAIPAPAEKVRTNSERVAQ
jgi:hypothetical protein